MLYFGNFVTDWKVRFSTRPVETCNQGTVSCGNIVTKDRLTYFRDDSVVFITGGRTVDDAEIFITAGFTCGKSGKRVVPPCRITDL